MRRPLNQACPISSKKSVYIFLIAFLIGSWGLVQAQDSKVTGGKVLSASESQTPPGKDRDKKSTKGGRKLEHEIAVTVPIPSFQMNSCQVAILTESHQRAELARVLATIEQDTCAPSRVKYEVSITVVDENGDYKSLLFSEVREPESGAQMEYSQDYPIGENVTLRRVMVRGVRCECEDP